jgi:EF hand domain-containing protein
MLRWGAGLASALLLIAAGFFIWNGRGGPGDAVPPAPEAAALMSPLRQPAVPRPPEASEKSKEEKRFARADKNKDGRITIDELYLPRRKAFAKLDGDKDGRLSFEEWAASTAEKFAKADADRSGWLGAREYEATKPKQKAKPRCRC